MGKQNPKTLVFDRHAHQGSQRASAFASITWTLENAVSCFPRCAYYLASHHINQAIFNSKNTVKAAHTTAKKRFLTTLLPACS